LGRNLTEHDRHVAGEVVMIRRKGKRSRGSCEELEARTLLAGLSCAALDVAEISSHDPVARPQLGAEPVAADALQPQYRIHQTPRLQPGNAPLYGTPADRNTDQVDILWQTFTIGDGVADTFQVRYRAAGANTWLIAALHPPLETGVNTRIIHSASLTNLDWNTTYAYIVSHYRGEQVLVSYDAEFTTRLAPGDTTSFSFTAYGDSATIAGGGFRQVQSQINELNPNFNLLLGDNFYDWGSHDDADARFTPELNLPATEWIAGHIDYFAIGNHDALLNAGRGQPSRDSFSVPVPIAGVNAYASPPSLDAPEHNYSFDYGDVHFVTFDSNWTELNNDVQQRATLDYVLADLQASTARWKIVYTHHPIVGTSKSYDETSGDYFQYALPLLRAAGADLLLAGDSHSYSWTFPLTGYADSDQDGTVEPAEVQYVSGSAREFVKGAGLVQVVSGVGGKSLHFDDYPDPFIAAGFSRHENTGPGVFGFSRVDVLPDRLVVSYIDAADGQIVGDTNGNGQPDLDEPFFGQFQLVDPQPLAGDLNHDRLRDVRDIDLLCAAILAQDHRLEWDLDGDRLLTKQDYERLIRDLHKVAIGDVNGDRRVNSRDLLQVFQAGRYGDTEDAMASWAEGDWNCDGRFDSTDLLGLFQAGRYEP
jgi:hypothetical protein